MTRWLILTALFLQIAQQPAASRKASIEGIVVRAGTLEPVADTRVELIGVRPDSSRVGPVSMITAGDGRFVLGDLDAGSYQLTFASNGYVRRVFPESGARVTLAAGQDLKGIVTPMTPAGSVSGHIWDRNGEPLAGVPVHLMQPGYDETGRRTLQAVGASPTDFTDDRGEYRLFYITPGKYYLYAGNPWIYFHNRKNDAAFHESYSYAYYPGVSDSREAVSVVVESGADVRGIDMMLDRLPVRRIRGRLVDEKTGRAPADVQVNLNFNDSALDNSARGEYVAGEKGTYENGVFEFRNVVPGSFVVSARVGEVRMGYAAVMVGNADVENVVITIPESASIRGRWRAEGQLPPAFRGSIRLTPTMSPASLWSHNWYDAVLNAGVGFELENVAPAEYRLSARFLPSGFYLKEARFGGADVLGRPLRFNGNGGGTLEIVLGANAGVVEGTAIDGRLQPFPYANVVLVPNRDRDRTDLFKAVNADENGRFSIANVTPGDYRVFAWESIEGYAWFDPERLRQAESNSVAVSVSEAARRSVTVRVK